MTISHICHIGYVHVTIRDSRFYIQIATLLPTPLPMAKWLWRGRNDQVCDLPFKCQAMNLYVEYSEVKI